MTAAEFNHSVRECAQPPPGFSAAVEALWWLAKGDWDRAHERAQEDSSAAGAWVHAHLHRVEGDRGNAGYWYRRAGQSGTDGPFEQEREAIIVALPSGRA